VRLLSSNIFLLLQIYRIRGIMSAIQSNGRRIMELFLLKCVAVIVIGVLANILFGIR